MIDEKKMIFIFIVFLYNRLVCGVYLLYMSRIEIPFPKENFDAMKAYLLLCFQFFIISGNFGSRGGKLYPVVCKSFEASVDLVYLAVKRFFSDGQGDDVKAEFLIAEQKAVDAIRKAEEAKRDAEGDTGEVFPHVPTEQDTGKVLASFLWYVVLCARSMYELLRSAELSQLNKFKPEDRVPFRNFFCAVTVVRIAVVCNIRLTNFLETSPSDNTTSSLS